MQGITYKEVWITIAMSKYVSSLILRKDKQDFKLLVWKFEFDLKLTSSINSVPSNKRHPIGKKTGVMALAFMTLVF